MSVTLVTTNLALSWEWSVCLVFLLAYLPVCREKAPVLYRWQQALTDTIAGWQQATQHLMHQCADIADTDKARQAILSLHVSYLPIVHQVHKQHISNALMAYRHH